MEKIDAQILNEACKRIVVEIRLDSLVIVWK
jgi:hypothetical protein